MIGYFRERNSFQVPALLFITIALKLVFITHPHIQPLPADNGLLSKWLAKSMVPRLNPGFLAILTILIIFLSSLFANYLLASSRMFARSHLLVALSMIMFTSLFPSSNQLSPAVLLLPLLILLFVQITKLYNNQRVRPTIINIGLLFGTGYLLYHPFLWLFPCCFIGLAGMRAFRLTEWLLLLLAMLTPFYFLLSYDFFTDQWDPMEHIVNWSFYRAFPAASLPLWIAIGAATAWILAGITGWQQQIRRMLIQSRKNWYQLNWLGVFIIPMCLFPAGNFSEAITLLSFPAGSIAANAFSGEKTTPSLLLFWFIVIAIAVAEWFYIH